MTAIVWQQRNEEYWNNGNVLVMQQAFQNNISMQDQKCVTPKLFIWVCLPFEVQDKMELKYRQHIGTKGNECKAHCNNLQRQVSRIFNTARRTKSIPCNVHAMSIEKLNTKSFWMIKHLFIFVIYIFRGCLIITTCSTLIHKTDCKYM